MYGWGWLAWNLGADLRLPHMIEAVADLPSIKQLTCSVSCVLILTNSGRVFFINYSSEMQVVVSDALVL